MQLYFLKVSQNHIKHKELHPLQVPWTRILSLSNPKGDNSKIKPTVSNPNFHERTKHIEANCYFVHEMIVQGRLVIGDVRTCEQLANIFTKALNTNILYL